MAPGAGPNLEVDVARVAGVGRNQEAAQLELDTVSLPLRLFELLPGEGLQLRVALAEHLFRFLDAGEGMTIAMVAFHQRAKLGVFASEPAKTHLVICHVGFGEQAGELFESIA